jgi:flagella basal body P-ring formation protein FlgA
MTIPRLIGICLLAALVLPGTAGALEVRFQPRAQVSGDRIALGDIASLAPESAGRKYADAPLFDAPEGGEVETYKVSTLKAYVLDALPSGTRVTWSGAEKVAVHRYGRLITGEDVADIVQGFLRARTEELAATHLDFTPDTLPEAFAVARGDLTHRVIPSSEDVIGSRYFIVRFRLNGELVQNVRIRGDLDATAPVAVAVRDLDRGTVLQKKDMKLVERDITRTGRPFTEVSRAVGKRVERDMESGDIIERRKVDRPVLVDRGEVVTMEARQGAMLLTAKGVARSKGKKGETIKVRNTGSEKEILCKVVGSGRVQVEF